jgi:4,5-DOPA dioxygenase extradiol
MPGTTDTMPAAFFGHGTPMNALDDNRYTRAWSTFGAAVPRPRAILVISAHWFINASAVTAMARPKTIHDFYGFPEELFAVQYPAPGDPDVALEIADAVHPKWIGLDHDSWGIDHGTWSVLVHAFPAADVPVLQLSINATRPFEYHLDLGARLAPLRERGVLIVGSGNVVHNLGRIDWSRPDAAFDWTRTFDDEAASIMTSSPADLPRLEDHDDFALAAPTPDHFIPLLYLAGLASAAGGTADVLVDGYAMGSLSMTSYTLGCQVLEPGGEGGSPVLPDVPAAETNL